MFGDKILKNLFFRGEIRAIENVMSKTEYQALLYQKKYDIIFQDLSRMMNTDSVLGHYKEKSQLFET